MLSELPVYAQDISRPSLPLTEEATNDTLTSSLNRASSIPVGTRISRGNIGDWKDRLEPEFTDLIRSGKMVAIAQVDHNVDWPNRSWLKDHGPESQKKTPIQLLDSKNNIEGKSAARDVESHELALSTSYPFGAYESIIEANSLSERADKILSNINSIFSSHAFQRTRADVLNFEHGKMFRGYKLAIERLYPKLIDPSNSSAQVFREKLTVLDPASIRGLSWLTFRFSGADEDLLFHSSPFARKSIQLSGPSRLDRIAGTSLALDDLLTWSGKPEIHTISSIDKSSKFFPLSYEKTLKTSETSGACTTISKDQASILLNTNHAQIDLADWAPLNIPFIERESITLNLLTTDFHNPVGKVVLQVDLRTFLPLTKSYYDRNGNLVKFVFSVFNLAETSSKFNFTPLASFIFEKSALSANNTSDERGARLMGKTPKTSDVSVVLYRSDERCSALPADMSLNDFDLKGFGIKVISPQDTKLDQSKAIQPSSTQITPSIETSIGSPSIGEATSGPTTKSKQSQTVAPVLTISVVGESVPVNNPQKNILPKQVTEAPQAQTIEPAPDND